MRIAYQQADGTVAIVVAAPKEALTPLIGRVDENGQRIPLTDQEYRDHVFARSIPAGATNVHELPDDWTAPDRYFRNAWVTDGVSVSIDLTRAKEVHRNVMRKARVPLLRLLDAEIAKAEDTGGVQRRATLATKRQALRDVTADSAVDAAQTPEQLKASWPIVLGLKKI